MGYYTVFQGEVSGPSPFLEQFEKDANEGETFSLYDISLSDFFDDYIYGGQSMKWYDSDADMKNLSKNYPALLFTLSGEGEDSGDIWRAYYRNGKGLRVAARIVFDEPEDLDEQLPLPPETVMQRERDKAGRKAEIDAEIARLEAERAKL